MNQQKMPLFDKLMDHVSQEPISFHVPGHKNGLLFRGKYNKIGDLDLTELSGLDDLHHPEGVILEAQQLLKDLYGTINSYFLVNGTTVGNLAMILASCQEGDYVLVQRNCHKSILNGLRLAKVQPIFLNPEVNETLQIPGGVNVEAVKKAFQQYPTIKACIFTYPDYYGHVYNLGEIIEFAHGRDSIVLVDEAHGAHFTLGEPFPTSAVDLGADIVVQSAHKTLPAFTMGSFLHVVSQRVDSKKIEFYLNILQSSSPSYLIMASLDYARHYVAHFSNDDLVYTLEKRETFLHNLKQVNGVRVVESNDPLKVIVSHENLTGYEWQSVLEEQKIYPELSDAQQVLFVLPLLKKEMEFPFEEAVNRVKEVSLSQAQNRFNKNTISQAGIPITKLEFSYEEMDELEYSWVAIKDSLGMVAAKMIIPYPPGIPLLLPGERIKEYHVAQLKSIKEHNVHTQGGVEKWQEGKIAVFLDRS